MDEVKAAVSGEVVETLKGKTHSHCFVDKLPESCPVYGKVMNTNITVHESFYYALWNGIRVSLCCGSVLSTEMISVSIAEVVRFY